MKTDDLIDALARDPIPASPSVPGLICRGLAFGAPVALVAMLATLGVREDAMSAIAEGWFGLKLALVALVALAAWRVVDRAARPGERIGYGWLGLAGLAFLAAITLDLGALGLDDWRERLQGDNAALCIVAIPLLSAAPLIGLIVALRDGAATNAALAGAAAGLLAGAVGAFVYGLHCSDDSPLFLGVWYVLGIGVVTVIGGLLGRRFLTW